MAIRSAGVDPRRYCKALKSNVFTGPLFTNYGGLIANERFEPAGFAASAAGFTSPNSLEPHPFKPRIRI